MDVSFIKTNFRNYVNDGSLNKPQLDIRQSWWAMSGLGNGNREWTLEEKFEKIAEAGFKGINSYVPKPEDQELWHRLLTEYNLSLSINAFPGKAADLREQIPAAKAFGVDFINAQVFDSFVHGDEAIELLAALLAESSAGGIPQFIETHRGRITQDLIRTADYVRALPQLKLTIDFSHYVLAGEMNASLDRAEPYYDVLLKRTSCIHARVSNGEQIQVDIGPEGEHPMTVHFKRWWKQGMAYWLQDARKGDRLPFVVELGPPTYAIAQDEYKAGQVEISDRWQQALLMKQIAEQLWQELQS